MKKGALIGIWGENTGPGPERSQDLIELAIGGLSRTEETGRGLVSAQGLS